MDIYEKGDLTIVNVSKKKKIFKILSIYCGGIKGLFSAHVLAKFEEVYKTNISDHFDLICGTSTGGIIALGISLKIPMSQICDFYTKYGADIFNEKCKITKFGRLKLLYNQIVGKGKYNSDKLKSALTEVFGTRTLSESNNLLCIPAYNIISAQPRVFKKDFGILTEDDKKLYVDVALATAAAPTYFPVKDISGEKYIDGGVWANNPALVGLTEYIFKFKDTYDGVEILSISSMEVPTGEVPSNPLDRSFLHWKDTLFDTFTTGQSYFNNFFMTQLEKSSIIPMSYKRISNCALSADQQNVVKQMDSADECALELLRCIGNKTGIDYKDDADIKRIFSSFKTYEINK